MVSRQLAGHLLPVLEDHGHAGPVPVLGIIAARAVAALMPEQRAAIAILHAVDQGGFDLLPAVDQHPVGAGQIHQRSLCRAQRNREIGREAVVDPEVARNFDDPAHADLVGQSNGHQVARPLQAFIERLAPPEGAVVVLRSPVGFVIDARDDPWVVEHGRIR